LRTGRLYEWSNNELEEATARTSRMLEKTRADAWQNVHEFVMQLAGELQ
jgi:hypothetical protein